MGLVSVDELLIKAEQEGYAVGAFNANNMEIIWQKIRVFFESTGKA